MRATTLNTLRAHDGLKVGRAPRSIRGGILCGAALLLGLLSGCRLGGKDGLPVSGLVLQAGQPVPSDGTLTLLPNADNPAPAVTTSIEQGRFEFTTVTGPRPGKYEALVQLFDPAVLLLSAPPAEEKLDPLGPEQTGEVRLAVEIRDEPPWTLELVLP